MQPKKKYPCLYNHNVDCVDYITFKIKHPGKIYPGCQNCGWNPAVSAERLLKLKGVNND